MSPAQTTPTPVPMPVPTSSSRSVSSNSSPGSFLESVLDALLKDGTVTQEQYDTIILENVNTGRPAEQVLEEKHIVSEEVLSKARSKVYNVPFVALREVGSHRGAFGNCGYRGKTLCDFPFCAQQTNKHVVRCDEESVGLGRY